MRTINKALAANTVANGLYTQNGETYYYANGVAKTGLQTVNGHEYYFDSATKQMKTNYFYTDINGRIHYFDLNGVGYQNKFYNNWGKTYYFGQDGTRFTDQFYNNWGNTYYFGSDGARYTNRFYNNWGNTYYFGNGGVRYTNHFYNGWGNTYYFGTDGALSVNHFYNNWGHTYYFGASGIRYTNRYYFNWDNLYYFGSDGALNTNSIVRENGNTYYTNEQGVITTRNSKIETAIKAGMTQIGLAPYDWGGGRTAAAIAAHRFDCSSFVHWAYAQAGIVLGNYTGATTYTEIKYGTSVAWNNMKRGDIFFMDNCGHVGIYLGGGYFLHDSPRSSTGGVGINNLSDVNPSPILGGKTWAQIADHTVRRLV